MPPCIPHSRHERKRKDSRNRRRLNYYQIGDLVKGLTRDPFILVAITSIIIGGLLNFSSVDRPEFYKTIIAVFVPLGTIMLLTSIGLALRFRMVRDYLKECVAVSILDSTEFY
jgi:hypothetical protein